MVYEAKPQKSDCCLLQRYSFDGISFSVNWGHDEPIVGTYQRVKPAMRLKLCAVRSAPLKRLDGLDALYVSLAAVLPRRQSGLREGGPCSS